MPQHTKLAELIEEEQKKNDARTQSLAQAEEFIGGLNK